jgi:hypothetical protein
MFKLDVGAETLAIYGLLRLALESPCWSKEYERDVVFESMDSYS